MFQQPLDIYNRALWHCGLPKMGTPYDQSNGQVIVDLYDDLRRSELERNLWTFATRTTALRALDTTSQFVTFENWVAGTTYGVNYVVAYNNLLWVSQVPGNLGNTPGTPAAFGLQPWAVYFGPRTANVWNDSLQNTTTSNNTSYHLGELVWYSTTSAIYASILEGNQNDPTAVDAWSSQVMYATGAVVSFNSVNYQSRVNQNFGYEPDTSATQWTSTVTNPTVSGSWTKLASASLSSRPVIYPVNAGPATDPSTRNAYFKPFGHLRSAPLDPKAGARAFLGAHVGLPYDDKVYQGDYITSGVIGSVMIERFIGDVMDVSTMHPMFCEGLGARLGLEAAPAIAPAREKGCTVAYNRKMDEARLADAIEQGPIEQDEDEWISVRI